MVENDLNKAELSRRKGNKMATMTLVAKQARKRKATPYNKKQAIVSFIN
jgi:hypothetical protein